MLKSLSTLTQILANARAPSDLGKTFTRPPHSEAKSNSLPANQDAIGPNKPGDGNSKATKCTCSEQPKDEAVLTQSRASASQDNLTCTKVLKTAHSKQPNKTGQSSSRSQNNVKSRRLKVDKLEVWSLDSEDVRPTTPVGVSDVEPCFSRVGRSVSSPCEAGDSVRSVTSVGVTEMEVLNESAVESRRQLTTAEEK